MSLEVGIRFDMRAPGWATPPERLYPAAHEMAEFADRAGVDVLLVGEHHGTPDGYTSAPFVVAASLAARTSSIKVRLRAMLLPLHDPVHFAEQLTSLDQVTAGRVEAVLGLGYVASEFAMFGVRHEDRVARLERGLAVLRDALAGHRFRLGGREGVVTPGPAQQQLQLYLGGGVAATARRAARFGLGFAPQVTDAALVDTYAAACRDLGRVPGPVVANPIHYATFVADDPDEFWARLEPHALHNAHEYLRYPGGTSTRTPFASDSGADDPAAGMRRTGTAVLTPEQCIDVAMHCARTDRSVQLVPLLGGLDPELGWSSLRLFATKVLPALVGAGVKPDRLR